MPVGTGRPGAFPGRRRAALPRRGRAVMSGLRVLKPGPQTLLQDGGRYGWERLGVSPAGPLDLHAAAWANRLLDNPWGTPLLEIALGYLELQGELDTWLALTGAQVAFSLARRPASQAGLRPQRPARLPGGGRRLSRAAAAGQRQQPAARRPGRLAGHRRAVACRRSAALPGGAVAPGAERALGVSARLPGCGPFAGDRRRRCGKLRARAVAGLFRPDLAAQPTVRPHGRAPARRAAACTHAAVVARRRPRGDPAAARRSADHPPGRSPDHGRLPHPRLAAPARPGPSGPVPGAPRIAFQPGRDRRGPGRAARVLSVFWALILVPPRPFFAGMGLGVAPAPTGVVPVTVGWVSRPGNVRQDCIFGAA